MLGVFVTVTVYTFVVSVAVTVYTFVVSVAVTLYASGFCSGNSVYLFLYPGLGFIQDAPRRFNPGVC